MHIVQDEDIVVVLPIFDEQVCVFVVLFFKHATFTSIAILIYFDLVYLLLFRYIDVNSFIGDTFLEDLLSQPCAYIYSLKDPK